MIKSTINTVKKNPLLFFIAKLFILFMIIFVFDRSCGKILSYFYFNQGNGMQYRTTFLMEKTNADLLIFGSSRATHHYYPDVFENRLKLSYYNAGRDGNFIFYDDAVLKGILKRYCPKIVVLDFKNDEFRKDQNSYDRISVLLPYYETHPEMRSIIELKSEYENLKLLSHIYPYNSSIFTIAAGNAEFNKNRYGDIKGYVPLNKIWKDPVQIRNSPDIYEIDSMKVHIYESFIQDCIQSDVRLYIVCSPYYIKYNYEDPSIILGREIAQKYNINFFDFSNDSLFLTKPEYFADKDHLNDTGAVVFSNLFLDRLIVPAIKPVLINGTGRDLSLQIVSLGYKNHI